MLDAQIDPELGAVVAELRKADAGRHTADPRHAKRTLAIESRVLEAAVRRNPICRALLELDPSMTTATIAASLSLEDRRVLLGAARSSVAEAYAATDQSEPVDVRVALSAPNWLVVQWSSARSNVVRAAAHEALDAALDEADASARSDRTDERRDYRHAYWLSLRLRGLESRAIASSWRETTAHLAKRASGEVPLQVVDEWRRAGAKQERPNTAYVNRKLGEALAILQHG